MLFFWSINEYIFQILFKCVLPKSAQWWSPSLPVADHPVYSGIYHAGAAAAPNADETGKNDDAPAGVTGVSAREPRAPCATSLIDRNRCIIIIVMRKCILYDRNIVLHPIRTENVSFEMDRTATFARKLLLEFFFHFFQTHGLEKRTKINHQT